MTSALSLPFTVEERLAGWAQILERRAKIPVPLRPGPTITLSRLYGCEGFPLALRLQERLSAASGERWAIFDKALIDKVAAEEGVPARILEDLGDATRNLESFGFHPRGRLTHDEAFDKVAQTLLSIAIQGRAIIVGRGGAILCKGLPNAYHFRLQASLEWRVASIVRRSGASEAEAEKLVRTRSRERDQFIKDRLGADVADPGHYDAVFNNERHGVESIAAAIQAFVGAAWGSEAETR
jgi:cytidylate kinase